MRILRTTLALVMVVTVGISPVVLGHSPPENEHGIDPVIFPALWSGDPDAGSEGSRENTVTENENGMARLAAYTDIPFDRPPDAVERWNRGEFNSSRETDDTVSRYPTSADPSDGRILADAFVEIFAIQPSTVVHLTDDRTPLYVGESGTVLALVDYRIDLPPVYETPERQVRWRRLSSSITSVRLKRGGRMLSERRGDQAARLPFERLRSFPGRTVPMVVTATISVRVQKVVERCTSRLENESCDTWNTTRREGIERLTVRDSRDVTVSRLSVTGERGRRPDGSTAVHLNVTGPWAGVSTDDGEVQTTWRFYTARDTGWDTTVRRSVSETVREHSTLHPLVVHAYPAEVGPAASGAIHGTVIGASTLSGPTLPEPIHLDVVSGRYQPSPGMVVRFERPTPSTITVRGVVGNVGRTVQLSRLQEVPIRPAAVNLSLLTVSRDSIRLRVELRELRTGNPIATVDRTGYVLVDGVRVETNTNGTAIVEVPKDRGVVTATYEPASWWLHEVGYTSADDSLYVSGKFDDPGGVFWSVLLRMVIVGVAIILLDGVFDLGITWSGRR